MEMLITYDGLINREKIILQNLVKNNLANTSFEPNRWASVIEQTNCYAYILDAPISLHNYFFFLPGTLSMARPEEYFFSEKLLEKRVFLDCKTLEIKIRKSSLEEKVHEKERKIAILSNSKNFHFLRYDNNNLWSQKPDWYSMPTNKDLLGLYITNPETMTIGGTFNFLGYYIIYR